MGSFSLVRPPGGRCWLLVLAIALALWGRIDVWRRARVDPLNPEAHRTDFTVYTEAGAAMFDGRDPYAVTNPRGWHYLYPPLFAILVAPLSAFDAHWQVAVWFAISVLACWGVYVECRRIWTWLRTTEQSAPSSVTGSQSAAGGPGCAHDRRIGRAAFPYGLPKWILWTAGATVLLPVLNCLQRGQVGVVLLYLLLLGFRWCVSSRTSWDALGGGIVLALTVAIKFTPALPVAYLCLQLIAAAWFDRWSPETVRRAAWVSLGTAAGLLLFFLLLPSAIIGWSANLTHLNTWVTRVVASENVGADNDFNIHAKANQSLANAVFRLGNQAAVVLSGSAAQQSVANPAATTAPKPMDHRWVQRGLLIVRLGLLALLFAAGWSAACRRDSLGLAAVFSLACMLTLVASPLSWRHHYVLWLPALWLVPLWQWRAGRRRLAAALAISACGAVWLMYLSLRWAGLLGVLGLTATAWYVAAAATMLAMTGTVVPIQSLLDEGASPSAGGKWTRWPVSKLLRAASTIDSAR